MASLAALVGQLVGSAVELVGRFADVAMVDPISGVLLTLGALITGVSVAVLGVLALGALADALTPEVGRAPPQQGR